MTATGKKKNISIEKRRERTAYLFIAPAAILIIAFCIIPLIASFYISTQKMGVDLSAAEFIGFDNYKKIVGDRRFWQSVGITLKNTSAEIPWRFKKVMLLPVEQADFKQILYQIMILL